MNNDYLQIRVLQNIIDFFDINNKIDDVIAYYWGIMISKEQFNEIYPKSANPPTRVIKTKYFGSNNPIYIDGSMSCAATYANSPFQTSSRDANTVLVERFYNKHNDMSKIVWLEAVKPIAKNEEILVEYGNEFVFLSNDDDGEKEEHENVITSSKVASQGIEVDEHNRDNVNDIANDPPVQFNVSMAEDNANTNTNTNDSQDEGNDCEFANESF